MSSQVNELKQIST